MQGREAALERECGGLRAEGAALRRRVAELEAAQRQKAEADAKVDELRRHITLMELELQEARAKLQEYREAEAKASGPSELQMAMERYQIWP